MMNKKLLLAGLLMVAIICGFASNVNAVTYETGLKAGDKATYSIVAVNPGIELPDAFNITIADVQGGSNISVVMDQHYTNGTWITQVFSWNTTIGSSNVTGWWSEVAIAANKNITTDEPLYYGTPLLMNGSISLKFFNVNRTIVWGMWTGSSNLTVAIDKETGILIAQYIEWVGGNISIEITSTNLWTFIPPLPPFDIEIPDWMIYAAIIIIVAIYLYRHYLKKPAAKT